MNDHEIDRMMHRADPESGLAGMLHEARQELLEEIMSETDTSPVSSDADAVEITALPVAPRRPARWLLGVAAAVAVALAIALPMTLFRGDAEVLPAGELRDAQVGSEGNPYLVLNDPGLSLTDMQQVEGQGYQSFTNAEKSLNVSWAQASIYQELYDAKMGFDPKPSVSSLQLLGREGTVFERHHDGDFVFMLPPGANKHYLEVYAQGFTSRKEFVDVLRRLQPVGEQEWIASLPQDAVLPDEAVEVSEQMMSDLPVPSGVKATDFRTQYARSYYVQGAEVVQTVTCGWLEVYDRARREGDQERLTEVDEVMRGSRRWAVLEKLDRLDEVADPEGDSVAESMGELRNRIGRGADLGDLGRNFCV